MILGKATRRCLEHLVGHRLITGSVQIGDDDRQLGTGVVGVHGSAEARQCRRFGHVEPAAHRQAVGGEGHVPSAEGGRAGGLVGRLVGAEPHVAVGPEQFALAELVGQFGQQLFHRRLDLPFVDRFVLLPEHLRVVGLETFVELDGFDRPSPERHTDHCGVPARLVGWGCGQSRSESATKASTEHLGDIDGRSGSDGSTSVPGDGRDRLHRGPPGARTAPPRPHGAGDGAQTRQTRPRRLARPGRGRAGRSDRTRILDRGVPGHGRRLLPGPFDGHVARLRRRGEAFGAERGRRCQGGRGAPGGVPQRAASARHLTVAAPRLAGRGRRDLDGIVRGNGRAAGRHRDRVGFGVVRDGPSPDRPAPGDDHPEVGAQHDPADRHRRRPVLPRRGGHRAGARVPHLGHRRAGRDGVRRRDAGIRRRGGAAAASDGGAAVPDADDRELVGGPGHPDPLGAGPSAGRIARMRRGVP